MSIVKRNQERALKAQLAKQGKQVEQKPVSQNHKPQEVTVDSNKKPELKTAETGNKELDMYGVAIDADKAQLKKFLTVEEKNDYKATALENTDYVGFIGQYLKSGSHYPNRVFAWVMVWLVDLGRWQQALSYLPILVKQQQPLPTKFNTKEWTTFFIDQLVDAGNRALKAQLEEPNAIVKSGIMKVIYTLITFIEQEKPSVNFVVLGKLFVVATKLEFELFNFGNALSYSLKATEANENAGAKGLTRKLIGLVEFNAQALGKEKQAIEDKKQAAEEKKQQPIANKQSEQENQE